MSLLPVAPFFLHPSNFSSGQHTPNPLTHGSSLLPSFRRTLPYAFTEHGALQICKLFASLCVGNALTTIPPFRYTYYYEYKISCRHFCNRACHYLRCARSITQPSRVARCVAFTRRVASGFAQGEGHSKEGQA